VAASRQAPIAATLLQCLGPVALLVLGAPPAVADPTIGNVTGPVGPELIVTVDGAGFGSVDPSTKILTWDDFEAQEIDADVCGSAAYWRSTTVGWNCWKSAPATDPIVFADTNAYSGKNAAHIRWIESGEDSFGWNNQGPYDRLYITYRRYMAGTYDPQQPDNHAQLWTYGQQGDFPQGVLSIPENGTNWQYEAIRGNGNASVYANVAGWNWTDSHAIWQRWELWEVLDDPSNANNGLFLVWRDGSLGISGDHVNLRSTSSG